MKLNKFCPFSGEQCNTKCALAIKHGHENHHTQQYDFTYMCGLISNGNMTRFTDEMKEEE